MTNTYDNNLKVSVWEKTAKSGASYLSGSTEINGKRFWTTMFMNATGATVIFTDADNRDNEVKTDMITGTTRNGDEFYKLAKPIEIDGQKYWLALFFNDSENPKAPVMKGSLQEAEELRQAGGSEDQPF